MKNTRTASAATVRMKVVLRASLLRAWVDSTMPTESPVTSTASGAAAHQRGQQVAATASAASTDSAAVLSHPTILI